MPHGGLDRLPFGPATRLLLCLMVSLVLHLLLVASGSPFSNASRVAERNVGAVITAALVSSESRSEISLSERSSEPVAHDTIPSVNAEKRVNSLNGKTANEGEKISNKPSGLVDSDRYYVRSELTQAPHVINDVLILAPPTKGDFAWTLRIRIFLSESGLVDRLIVEDSTAPAYVEEDALEQFRSARYAPGFIGGQRVKSQLLIDVTEP